MPDGATAEILTRLKNDMVRKTDPSFVEYLINKGKSEEDVASYLMLDVSEIHSYVLPDDRGAERDEETNHQDQGTEERDRHDAAMAMMSCFTGGGLQTALETEAETHLFGEEEV